MREIAISKFKSTCLAVIDDVSRTRKPIRITRFGKPVADLQPTKPRDANKSWLGCMSGTGELDADTDIVKPIGAFEPWNPGTL